jgi:hypothetical protein
MADQTVACALPVAFSSQGWDLLADGDGNPLWPLSSEDELSQLERLAELFESQVVKCDPQVGRPREPRTGAVAALDPVCHRAARLYAHLTDRRLVPFDSVARLRERAEVDVLIAPSSALTTDLLDALYEPSEAFCPGIISGASEGELHAQVLLRAASAHFPVRPGGHGIFVGLPGDEESTRAPADVRQALAYGAAILAVLTHSDGIDAGLARNLIACPVLRPPSGAPGGRSPDCHRFRWCHRMSLPLDQAVSGGHLVGADGIRARVLVWSACSAVVDERGPVDRRWSFVHQIQGNPAVAAAVATWRTHTGHGPALELAGSLAAGVSLGEAVRRHNQSATVRGRGCQLAILGDPRLSAPEAQLFGLPRDSSAPGHAPSRTLRRPAHARAATTPAPALEADIQLLEAIADGVAAREPGPRSSDIRERFSTACAALRADPVSSRSIAAFQEAGLAVLTCHPRPYLFWSGLSQKFEASRGRACDACRQSMTETVFEPGDLPSVRRISACPSCLVAEDAPVQARLGIRVLPGGTLELLGEPLPGRFAACGKVWSMHHDRGAPFTWPTNPDGSPVRMFRPELAWPSGVTRVAVWILFGTSYVMLSHRLEGTASA